MPVRLHGRSNPLRLENDPVAAEGSRPLPNSHAGAVGQRVWWMKHHDLSLR
jgi:hypothetical protein